VRTRGVPCIRSRTLKFQAPRSLATLSKFLSPRSLSLYCHPRNYYAAICHLQSLIPAPEHATVLFLNQLTLTPPPLERVAAVLFLKPSTSTAPPSEHAVAILFLKPSTSTPLPRSTPPLSTSTPLPRPSAKVTPLSPPSLPLPCKCLLDLKDICSLM
jgi:hypothetical protein